MPFLTEAILLTTHMALPTDTLESHLGNSPISLPIVYSSVFNLPHAIMFTDVAHSPRFFMKVENVEVKIYFLLALITMFLSLHDQNMALLFYVIQEEWGQMT